MPRRHNTLLLDRTSLGATAAVLERDLPINPISFITLTLRLLNNGVNAIPSIATILSKIANLEVLLEGKTLAGGSLADLAALCYALWGTPTIAQPITKTDNNVINVTVHIPFSRQPWRVDEALPATRKGDLSLRLTSIADPGGVDTYTATIEVRQILDSDPTGFLKYSTSPKTPTAAGDHEMDLVTGPDYLGVLFFGTTAPSAASQNASIARLKLKVDDVEHLLPESRWESLNAALHLHAGDAIRMLEHTHISDLAAAYTQFQNTGPMSLAANSLSNYAYVDFDPLQDNAYRLITRGRSRAHFVINADVADLIRMLPIEIIPLIEAPQAGA
jgi:hypothetical protein